MCTQRHFGSHSPPQQLIEGNLALFTPQVVKGHLHAEFRPRVVWIGHDGPAEDHQGLFQAQSLQQRGKLGIDDLFHGAAGSAGKPVQLGTLSKAHEISHFHFYKDMVRDALLILCGPVSIGGGEIDPQGYLHTDGPD